MGSKPLQDRLDRIIKRAEAVSPRAYARRLGDLSRQLHAARTQPSPGLALHRAGARTTLFQLECLVRTHKSTLDEETFTPLHAAFKSLEDALGAVDFSDSLASRPGVAGADTELTAYFVGRRSEAAQWTERILARGGWWTDGERPSPVFAAVLDAIESFEWPSPRKERRLLLEFFSGSAKGLQDKLSDGGFNFNDLEGGVHELRRKIRWLSILPASLDGLFVRREGGPIDPGLAAYCTPKVVGSPYNHFPPREGVSAPIELESSSFLAVSWLIAELGALKDRGQLTDAFTLAAQDLDDGPKAAAARVRKALGDTPMTHAEVGAAVAPIVATFTADGVLARLARGTR
jgi:hypothetical protein